MSKFVLNCVTERPGGVRQQVANGRLPQRGRSLGRPPPKPLEDPWFPKARRDARRRLTVIQTALLSQLLVRLVPGQPAGEQQLSWPVPCGHSPDPLADPNRFSIRWRFGASDTSALASVSCCACSKTWTSIPVRASTSAAAIAPRPPAPTARSARSFPLSDRRGVQASWPARPGPARTTVLTR